MSFRLFVFYCCISGAWAAFLGWGVGRLADVKNELGAAAVEGLYVGLFLAGALAILDSLWNFSPCQVGQFFLRLLMSLCVGGFAGAAGGALGRLLYDWTRQEYIQAAGWALSGLLLGASVAAFDLLSCVIRNRNPQGVRRKLVNGLLGGFVGGLVGGLLAVSVIGAWRDLFRARGEETLQRLWSPAALGFVVAGACTGLSISLSQVLLKRAWIKVEAGSRTRREVILSKPETTIGRARTCDIGLSSDPGLEPVHARVLMLDSSYYLADAGTSSGTFLNGQRVVQLTQLHAGDAIRVSGCVLRFGEWRRHG